MLRANRGCSNEVPLVTVDDYNTFCRSLAHTTHVVQWGGAHVWKIGGKVFAIGGWNNKNEQLFVTFKCSDMSYDMLKDMPGCRPAPYLASRGMKWIQRTGIATLDDGALRDYLAASYDLVARGLPKHTQRDLGLVAEAGKPAPHIKRNSRKPAAVAKPTRRASQTRQGAGR